MIRKPFEASVPGQVSSPSTLETEIRQQLERILNSHHFRASKRCFSLLQHITERTLAGDTAGLKERSLGVDVFGRATDYDTNQDPVVRAAAGEIRKRLAQYYQEPEHARDLRITLLPGSYVPEFHPAEAAPAMPPPPAPPRRGWVMAAAVILLTAGLPLAIWGIPHWRPAAVEQFWSPVLQSKGDILICRGQQAAYNLKSLGAQNRMQSGKAESSKAEGVAARAIPLKDLASGSLQVMGGPLRLATSARDLQLAPSF